MLCWKKASYSTNKKQDNSNNSNSKVNLTSITKKYTTNSNALASIRKKNSPKNNLTIRFKSNIN